MSIFQNVSTVNVFGGQFNTFHISQSESAGTPEERIRDEVKTWLSPVDYEQNLDMCKEARLSGTCNWILEKLEFSRWLSPNEGGGAELWVNGKPGCGKTILASFIIETVKNSGQPVIYFFCSSQYTDISRGAKRDETLTVIRTLIYQLAVLDPSLFVDILHFRKDSMSPGNLSAHRLWELFLKLAAKFERLYCIIDGLDECVDRKNEQLLRKLLTLKTIPSARALLISRNVPDIYGILGGDPHNMLRITSNDMHDDNRKFILAEIQGSSKLRDLPEYLRDNIVEKLQSAGDGLFLYSKLTLRRLHDAPSVEGISYIMQDLPGDLRELYKTTYQELQQKFVNFDPLSRDIAKLIFAFAVFGFRPLRLEEFSEASKATHGLKVLSEDKDINLFRDHIQNIERLASPLVEVVGGQIRVIHHSARQFLEEQSGLGHDQAIMDRENSHQRLLECCLDYLSLSIFRTPLLSKRRFENATKAELTQHHPFLEYAAQHWVSHLQPDFDTPSPKSPPVVLSFLSSKSFTTWVQAAIIFSFHLDNLGFVVRDIERWISRAPDGHSDVFKLSQWLQNFRGSIYDWCDAILTHPGEVHWIEDFVSLGSKNLLGTTQKLMRFSEESGRRVFPSEINDYNFFERHDSIVALTRQQFYKRDDDSEDPIVIVLHNWDSGNCLKVLRLPAVPSILELPKGTRISFRSIAFSPDGNYIAATTEPYDIEGPISLTTYVWTVTGPSEDAEWTHTSSRPTRSYDFSVSAISFPNPKTILCPSGLFDLKKGTVLATLPDDFDNCCSLTFRSDVIGLIRSTHVLEVWRINPKSHTFGNLSKLQIRLELGWSAISGDDSWVIRDISASGKMVLLTDYESMITVDTDTEKFRHYYTLEGSNSDLRANFSPDEKKFATFIKGYQGQNFHGILCTSISKDDVSARSEEASKPFVSVRQYSGTKPPECFRFDPDSNFIHTCSIQKASYNWLSVFHSIDCRVKWKDDDAECRVRDSENQAFVFGFSKSPDVLHVSKFPCPPQPLVMGAPSSFRLEPKDGDEDDYTPAHWSQQDIEHQCWSFRDGVIKSAGVSVLDPSLYHIVLFFRRYPHAACESPVGLLRFMGNKFEVMEFSTPPSRPRHHRMMSILMLASCTQRKERKKLPGSNFPVVWNMKSVEESISQLRRVFDPPLDKDHFTTHLQQIVISLPQKAVAMIGAFDKADVEDGMITYPLMYSNPFICIRKLDNRAALLWQWHGRGPEFSSSNLVVSFAFSPDPDTGLFAFSTRVALLQGDGLYVVNHRDGLKTKPRRISRRCADQLIFNATGKLLFAITGNCEKKADDNGANYFVLSVYEMMSFTTIRRIAAQSPFADNAQAIYLSWQLSENGQDLEQIHVSAAQSSQALHARLCTETGELSTRVLGSLPTMSGTVEVSKFAIDGSVSQDVRVNVAFRFNNLPPLAISFPDVAAGPWQHVSGVILTDENHNEYQSQIKRLNMAIEWMQYQEDEKKLDEMTKELSDPELIASLEAEKVSELKENIDKTQLKLAKSVTRLKEMLSNWEC